MTFSEKAQVKMYKGNTMNRGDTLHRLVKGDICKVTARKMENGRIRCKIETKYSEFRKTYPSQLDYELDWTSKINVEEKEEDLLWN